MKAAVLKAFGTPLVIEDVPAPTPGMGAVVVDVVATGVLAYSGEVLSGQRQYALELPCVPGGGAIGRVRAVGPDATKLAVGDWVYCDPTFRSRDDAANPDITLQGISARGEGGLRLQRHFRDGAWAEQTRVPTENAIRIGALDPAEAGRWVKMGSLLVPYGGFLAAKLQPGETVVVSGATGGFGGAAVAVALAMGAAWIVATGRNAAALVDLERRFGPRVRTVRMTGDEVTDHAAIRAAAPGPIDCVFDILPPAADATQARAALMTVRPNGRIVLMGGINMQGGAGLELPYAWIMRNCITIHGQWMYPPHAATLMANLIRAGLIDLTQYDVAEFPLDRANEAVAHAAATAGPFAMTVLRP
ncbi:L-threonine 3-dehydrogenase [Alphaproteobacteria bacterium SO-S41]|nr:L-threonine 3-dehydrogenase [Alphaproteobacteria bacterium SO-S41]